jgi:hypothetical protein
MCSMSVRFIFRCQFCEEQPDPLTQLSLETAMRETTWGAYQDALPGKWLVFHGRGLYGMPRYACPEHRADLVTYLREHYGSVGFHVWKRPPYPSSLKHPDTDKAWYAATRRQGGWGS